MPRQDPARPDKQIVKGQARLDGERAAFGRPVAPAQQVEGAVEEARKDMLDGHRGGQGTDEMGRIAEQRVAFRERFAHEAELAVLEITQAAMDHPRGGGTAGAAEVAAIDEEDV